ncbi:DHA2 family efflux MFS transporter permease subunit [Zophobihabitans entericus]|uniref:DHA2 family efflux MFS transporter permease subunit n=1 Tax=Zophobihabitans entericus TaxID=1635327 RepID=A0A6G9IAZ4_9GAMM|nr:DHA2 family efflux MFS transporter permease subunit [Zophobihabitans entericus]QIQ20894.1 DHA2 family efflux MFS transporter permease subunit [Zophobihabitans entericus]
MTNSTEITPVMYRMMPWIAAMAFFMQTLDTSILNTALPSMAVYLNESPLNMQSAVISYALTLALFIPVSGFLADRFGTQRVFTFSVFLFTLGSLFCALSNTLFMLDVSRVVQGVGGAMMMPVSRLTLIKSFKRSEFLAALNASTMPGLIGPVVGPVLGGYLVEVATWHWIFLINIPIGIIGIIMGIKYMPNIKGNIKPFDGLGFGFIALCVISLTLSLEFISEGLAGRYSLMLFAAGMILLGLYIYRAKRIEYPLFPLGLFSIRTFRIGIIGNLVSRLGISAIPLLIPLLLQVAFSYSSTYSGLILMPMAIASLTMKTLVQPILRRFGYRRVLLVNTMLVGLMIMSLSQLTQQTPIIVICGILFCVGFVNSLQFTSMNSITLADLEGENTSSGNSLMAVNQQLAISFGVAFGAVLITLLSEPSTVIPHNVDSAFEISFIILGLVTFFSSIIFTRLTPKDGQNLTIRNRS